MISHDIAQCQCTCDVVLVIFQRFYGRFSYCFQSCEMNDCLYIFFIKDSIHCFFVADVCFVECYFFACDLFYTIYCFFICIVQIVYDDYFIAFVQQFHTGVASNISSSAGYQNSHSIYLLINLINSFFIFIFS